MRKLKIKELRVKVTAHFHEEGSVLRGDKRGHVEGFDVEISFETEEAEETIEKALELAHQMCFTEAAITQAVPVRATHAIRRKD